MIKQHFHSSFALLGVAFFASSGLALRPARAQDAPPAVNAPARPFEGLVVQGNGEVRVKPDIARLNLGVQTQDKDVQRASGDNATRTQALIAALRGAGVEERDIQTAGFSIAPQYDYRPRPGDANGAQQPILTGYQVSNEVRVVVRRLDSAGRVLDAAIRAGANTASGIAFDLNDRQPSRDEALRRAVADAARKARILSEAAGTGPVRPISIVEGSAEAPPRPLFTMARAAGGAEASTPVEAGEIVINASITAYYATQTR